MTTLDETLRASLQPPGAWLPTRLRLASVLCPIVVHRGEDHLLLVVRPADQRQHSGQIAFPGGMREGDETSLETALRECHEEVGVPAAAITVLGSLPPRESSSGISVHCIVGRLQPMPLVPDPHEVVRVLHVPVHELCDDSRWQERTPPPTATGYQPRTSPHFVFAGDAGCELLWGLTARFVRDLVSALR